MIVRDIDDETYIREAEVGDVERLLALERICFSHPWTEDDFRSEIVENDLALYYLLMRSDEIVGYAGIWCVLNEGQIINIAIHPDCRGEGLGSIMLETLMDCAAEVGGAEIYTLEVRKSNQEAIALYEKFGFVEEGIRPEYYADNKEDALIMWKR